MRFLLGKISMKGWRTVWSSTVSSISFLMCTPTRLCMSLCFPSPWCLYAKYYNGLLLTIEFLPQQHKPVFLEDAAFLLLFQDLTLNVDGVLALAGLAGVLGTDAWQSASAILLLHMLS